MKVNCAVTYAFSLHRLGRNAEALTIIQSLPPERLHDAHAAVYVALVLVEGNEIDGAKDYIATAENGKLYPEEKKLLEEAKTKLIAPSAIPSPQSRRRPAQHHRCRVRCPQRVAVRMRWDSALQRSPSLFFLNCVCPIRDVFLIHLNTLFQTRIPKSPPVRPPNIAAAKAACRGIIVTIHFPREKSDQRYLPRTSPWPASAGMSVRFSTLRALVHGAQRSHDSAERRGRSPSCYATHLRTPPPCTRRRSGTERSRQHADAPHRSAMKLIALPSP